MATITQTNAAADNAFAVDRVSRAPQQGRSKASLERMLAAATAFMIERGSEEFTLQEVSTQGNVSIGSIYLRFESKENLVRAVIAHHLEQIVRDEAQMIADITSRSKNLDDLIRNFVDAFAEFLRKHAPLLRLSMARAEFDSLISGPGKEAASRAARLASAAMLAFADEFGSDDRELRAMTVFDAVFSTLARHLSLGSSAETADEIDWPVLKRELARMCLAYLKFRE